MRRELNELSAAQDKPVSRVVRAALTDYIDRHREAKAE
jgi:predicted transcriptional regulator